MSDAKKPAAKVTLFPVSVAIWANKTDKGTFYSVTIASRYKDKDGRWKNSVSLNENDLLLAAKALDLAHSEILKLRANDRQSHPDEDAA
jgi:hypothetical protein